MVQGLYHYHSGEVFLPGAGNAAFEPRFAYPVVNVFGRGIIAGNPPSTRQSAQVYVTQATRVSGIGGVLVGQMIHQPLNVPDTTLGEQ
jgi:hypothetical protein